MITKFKFFQVIKDASNEKITNLADGTASQDAVNYRQLQNITMKYALASSTGNIVDILTAIVVSFDNVTVSAGHRILVPFQTNKAENGIYEVYSDSGLKLRRVTDADSEAEIPVGLKVQVWSGDLFSKQIFMLVPPSAGFVLGTSDIETYRITGTGLLTAGDGIDITGNTISFKKDPVYNDILLGVTGARLNPTAIIFNYFVRLETPSGDVNGSNKVFTLEFDPAENSETVTYNGTTLDPGGDYTINYTTKEITFVLAFPAPSGEDKIRVTYFKSDIAGIIGGGFASSSYNTGFYGGAA